MTRLHKLPSELLIYLVSFLDAYDVTSLQRVCKTLYKICRDENIWRVRCFEESISWSPTALRRSSPYLEEPAITQDTDAGDLQESEGSRKQRRSRNKTRLLANWDPSYKQETVDWYAEYIKRHAPIQVNWLEQPRSTGRSRHSLDSSGVALYRPSESGTEAYAVAPVSDGSVCLWDVGDTDGLRNRLMGRSSPGLLYTEGTKDGTNPGATDTISIDGQQGIIYVAVQHRLIEIDAATMRCVNETHFPNPITALSPASHTSHLTVGTLDSIILHDRRDHKCPIEASSGFNAYPSREVATLHQPSPVSIIHVPKSVGTPAEDIYVAGRFASILHYDRRFFPRLASSIHSGAQLCGLAWLPCISSYMDKKLARHGQLSLAQVSEYKSKPGTTILACGEYRSKGSLEVFGLGPAPFKDAKMVAPSGSIILNSSSKNRQTSSSSKLLSIANHGTSIVVSDGVGDIKWFERDGVTEIRRCNLSTGHGNDSQTVNIFGTVVDDDNRTAGDIVRKIVPLANPYDTTPPSLTSATSATNDLLLWTGDKIASLRYSHSPGTTADAFDEPKDPEALVLERMDRDYSAAIRRMLEDQANEVRYVHGLGLGMNDG